MLLRSQRTSAHLSAPQRTSAHLSAPQRTSALLVVLWVLALPSFLITSMMVATQDDESTVSRRLVSWAQQFAEHGAAL